jgi:hypothetical protein
LDAIDLRILPETSFLADIETIGEVWKQKISAFKTNRKRNKIIKLTLQTCSSEEADSPLVTLVS